MKSALQVAMAWAPLLFITVFVSPVAAASAPDRTMTKVVKMLEGMLQKSKEDGDKDREIYAKFKCYCDTKEADKTANVEELTKEIAMLESDIEELQGANGELSTQCAKLKADMASNQQAQQEAQDIRGNENKAYLALKADSEKAIGQMEQAIDTLADVGADQTVSESADHAQFMAKASLIKLDARVKDALTAASAFLPEKHAKTVVSFMQAPFTGTYSAQSGEVVGILKNMRDTFKENLEAATAQETAQLEAFNKLMKTLMDAYGDMSTSYNKKQGILSSDDSSLATKKSQLGNAEKEKETDEAFLSQLLPMCEEKAKEYKERNMLRASEDAAISEAIAILNKDSAFATFGSVDATSSGATGTVSFLQMATVRSRPTAHSMRLQAVKLLQAAAGKDKPLRLVRVLAMLEADNPFSTVLDEIAKMIQLIADEGAADKKQLDWCKDERKTSKGTIQKKSGQIDALQLAIDGLIKDIEDPVSGLKATLLQTENDLNVNYDAQKTQTATRTEENAAYQEDIANLVQAQKLIGSAIKVLNKYYSKIPDLEEEASTPQTLEGETAAAPGTWEKEEGYKGQSSAGDNVIKMLTFIKDETAKEEQAAHNAEKEAQHSFEDSMTELTGEQATLQKSLLSLKKMLAEKETELDEKKEDKLKTEEEKAAVEQYLVEIKPGCDFISTNFELREKRRRSEKLALEKASGLLKGTPAYKSAVAEQHLEDLGKCKDDCVGQEENVVCKACLADTSVPGYCAGHPGTEGC